MIRLGYLPPHHLVLQRQTPRSTMFTQQSQPLDRKPAQRAPCGVCSDHTLITCVVQRSVVAGRDLDWAGFERGRIGDLVKCYRNPHDRPLHGCSATGTGGRARLIPLSRHTAARAAPEQVRGRQPRCARWRSLSAALLEDQNRDDHGAAIQRRHPWHPSTG